MTIYEVKTTILWQDYTENYYKLFTNTVINRQDINIAMNRVIKRFNSIFIK